LSNEELVYLYGHILHNTVEEEVQAFVSQLKCVDYKTLFSEIGVSHFAARCVIVEANKALEVIGSAVKCWKLMLDNDGHAGGADIDRVGLLGPRRKRRLVGDIKPLGK
jgi:hypothetical protein